MQRLLKRGIPPQTSPPDGSRFLEDHIHNIVYSHASNIAERALAPVALLPDDQVQSVDLKSVGQDRYVDETLLKEVCEGAGSRVIRWLQRVMYHKLAAMVYQQRGLGRVFLLKGGLPYGEEGTYRNNVFV